MMVGSLCRGEASDCFTLVDSLPKELLALDRWLSRSADRGIIGDDATLVCKVFHCVEIGTIDTDLRRTVHFMWKRLIKHLSLFQTDGEAEVLGCIREAVDDVL